MNSFKLLRRSKDYLVRMKIRTSYTFKDEEMIEWLRDRGIECKIHDYFKVDYLGKEVWSHRFYDTKFDNKSDAFAFILRWT